MASIVGRVSRCANCATPLSGEYCSACGQRARDLHRPFLQFVSDAIEHTFSIDTKLARTVRPLLVVPGEITRAYLAGRRVAFVPPLRAYLIAALIFFGLFSVFPSEPQNVRVVIRGSAEERETLGSSGTTFSLPERVPMFDAAYQDTLARARRDPRAFARSAYSAIPRLFFLFLPMFALYLELFYRKQGYYFEHLVFSLYYHAAVFVAFSAWFLIGRTDAPTIVVVVLRLALAAWVVAYLPLALRRVYGGSWPMTILKVSGLGVAYFMTAAPLGAVLMVFWAFLTF